MEDWDPHVILGLPPDATRDDVRRAYRRLARMYHPDKNPGDERAGKRFRMIQRAYRTLSDPALAVPPIPEAAPAPPARTEGWGDIDVDDDDDDDEFEDAFEADIKAPVEDRAEVEAGDDEAEELDPSQPGRKPRPKLKVVRAEVRLLQVLKTGSAYLDVPGVGRVAVKIPGGADTGSIVAGIVRNGDTVERLAVELRVLPDPNYRRRGLDLVTRVRIDTATAWRGTVKVLRTPWGRIQVSIPARSRWGDVVRIPCKGIMGQDGWGSLFVELSRH